MEKFITLEWGTLLPERYKILCTLLLEDLWDPCLTCLWLPLISNYFCVTLLERTTDVGVSLIPRSCFEKARIQNCPGTWGRACFHPNFSQRHCQHPNHVTQSVPISFLQVDWVFYQPYLGCQNRYKTLMQVLTVDTSSAATLVIDPSW